MSGVEIADMVWVLAMPLGTARRGGDVLRHEVDVPFLLLLLASAGLVRSAPLLAGSSVLVEDIGGFDELIRAQILRQKVPLDLVAVPDVAEYVLRESISGDLAAMSAGIEIVEISSGKIAWAASTSKQAGAWRWSRDAASKAAQEVVEQLRNAMRSRR